MAKFLYALLAFALPAWSAPFALQVGDTRVVLDAPPGYSDTTFTGSPRLQELAESLTSASNRILLFAVSDADLRRFSVGDPPEFRRYMLIATPRTLERERLSPAAFKRLAEESLPALAPLPEGTDIGKHLESRPVGAPTPLAELARQPAAVSLLVGTRLEPTKIPRMFGSEERQNFMLASSTLLHLRGKALNLSVFSMLHSPEDAAWVRSVTASWIDQLQRLNR